MHPWIFLKVFFFAFVIFILACSQFACTKKLISNIHEPVPKEWASRQYELGISLYNREQGEKEDNLEEAITYFNQALRVYTLETSPKNWANTHYWLGVIFNERIQGIKADNLEQSIIHFNQALQVYTLETSPKNWANTHYWLGVIFDERIQGIKADNLEQAIIHFNQALQVYTLETSPKNWANTHYWLGIFFYNRIKGDEAENIEKAITHFNQGLQVYTFETFPQYWAKSQDMLGKSFYIRTQGNEIENLNNAIIHFNQALKFYTRDTSPNKWAEIQEELAVNYQRQFAIYGIAHANEQSITYYQQALQFYTRNTSPQKWAEINVELGSAYGLTRTIGEKADNIRQGIKHLDLASQVFTREAFSQQWGRIQVTLATIWGLHVLNNDDWEKNLEQAVKYAELALQVLEYKKSPDAWTAAIHALSLSYGNAALFSQNEAFDLLTTVENKERFSHYVEQAIFYSQKLIPYLDPIETPLQLAMAHTNLAHSFVIRIQGMHENNIEHAIDHLQEGLQLLTPELSPTLWAMTHHYLSLAYTFKGHSQHTRETQLEYYSQAIAYAQIASNVITKETFPDDLMKSKAILSMALLRTKQYSAAIPQLLEALEINENKFQVSFTPGEQKRLAEEGEPFFSSAVWAEVQNKNYTNAVNILEWGKTRMVREKLVLNTVNYQNASPLIQEELRKLKSEITNLEFKVQSKMTSYNIIKKDWLMDVLKDKHQQFRKKLSSENIFISHSKQTDIINIIGNLSVGNILILPVFSLYGTAVFILPANTKKIEESHVLILPEFSSRDLTDITRGSNNVDGYFQAYKNWRDETDKTIQRNKRIIWQDSLNSSLKKLNDGVLKHILNRMEELNVSPGSNLIWLTDSDSSLLPLHAATFNEKPLLTSYTVQFIPSLYSLQMALENLTRSHDKRADLLAIIDPTQDLYYARIEGDLISQSFSERKVLETSDASLAEFEQALKIKPTYLHFATHGSYQWQNPLESGLELSQGKRLTLGYLLSKPHMLSESRLAILSACETGFIDISVTAESIGLPISFLQAGVPGVISTLWAVNDLSTTFLMSKFYELHREQNIAPPKALAQAQEWLSKATYADLRDWLNQYMLKSSLRYFVSSAEVLDWLRNLANKHTKERPYQEPYYWAGFMYVGI